MGMTAVATVLIIVGAVIDGAAYGGPAAASDAWAGQDGQVAIGSNGGWIFVPARRGWRAVVLDDGAEAIFDGTAWRQGATTLTPGGGVMAMRSVQFDVTITAGASVTTPIIFPERAMAFGVTGRVITEITGAVTTWDIGVAGDLQRYGSGLGVGLNSWVNGPGTPTVMWTPTALELTAQGGDFASGTVRLVAHYAELGLPDAV